MKQSKSGSNIAKHVWTQDHKINFDECEILDKATYRHRATLESWHTATTVNSDNNAQHLPEQYRFLLKKNRSYRHSFIFSYKYTRFTRVYVGDINRKDRLPGWKFLHINTHKRASPAAGMKVQRYRRKLFLTTVKTIQCNKIVPVSGITFSHINTREIHAYRAVSLSGQPGFHINRL